MAIEGHRARAFDLVPFTSQDSSLLPTLFEFAIHGACFSPGWNRLFRKRFGDMADSFPKFISEKTLLFQALLSLGLISFLLH